MLHTGTVWLSMGVMIWAGVASAASPATTRAASAPTSQPATTPSPLLQHSFAALVPDDVRAFVEIRNLAHLERRLVPEGRWAEWTRLAAGQTSRPSETVAWGERVVRILGMDLAEASRSLFGNQAALAAPTYDDLADAVVLSRVADAKVISELLTKNKAAKQAPIADVACHTLQEGLSLAVKGKVFVLGRRGGKTKLFDRTVARLGGQKAASLITKPAFVQQVRRFPAGATGILYLDLPGPDGTARSRAQPSPTTRVARAVTARKRPRAQSFWSSFTRLAIGLYPHDRTVDLEVRGLLDRPAVRGGLKDVSLDAIGRLPASTLFVWAQTMDLARSYRQFMADRSPDQRMLRFNIEVVKALLQPIDLEKDFLDKLGPQVMLVGGCYPGERRDGSGGYDLPLVSLMVESQDVQASCDVLQRFAERLLGWMNVQFARARQGLELRVVTTLYRNTRIHSVPLRDLFARGTTCPYLKTLEICWAGLDRWVVISTHPDHIRQLIDAGSAKAAERFASTTTFQAVRGKQGVASLVLASPDRVADMLQSWLDYCKANATQVFKPFWWKRVLIRRAGRRVALGIIIKEGAEPGRVVVGNPVLPEMPAHGRLRPGDKISAVDGRSLSEDTPEDDLRDFLAMRKGASVVLRVERDGKLLDVRIPMPPPQALPLAADVDPIGAIRYLINLCRSAEAGGYVRLHTEPHEFHANLMLKLKAPSK